MFADDGESAVWSGANTVRNIEPGEATLAAQSNAVQSVVCDKLADDRDCILVECRPRNRRFARREARFDSPSDELVRDDSGFGIIRVLRRSSSLHANIRGSR